MPHIKQELRQLLKDYPNQAAYDEAGQLVFLFTVVLCRLWRGKPRYQTIFEMWRFRHTIISQILEKTNPTFSFEDAKAAFELSFFDFYNRVGVPYELKKAQENGDVYVEEGVLPKQGEACCNEL